MVLLDSLHARGTDSMGDFIHTADTHLGYQQYHRPERTADFIDAFEQVIDAAITREVDAVVHAGDLFHDSRPSTATIQTALAGLRRLAEADIEFLAVVGNHDGTQDAQWIDIFSELGLATHLGSTPHIVADTAFYGLDYVPESRQNTLDFDFPAHDAEYAVFVLHGLVAPLSPHGTWDAEHLIGRSPVAFDAVLLGDDHAPRIERINGVVFTYPGSPERTAIDQTRDRVCNYIETGATAGDVWIDQVAIDARPHQYISITLAPEEGADRIKQALEKYDLSDAVVAVEITGDGRDITPAALEEYGKQQGALVVRVNDRRDLDTAHLDIDVSFADPDQAVKERLREMALSVPGYEIERLVRDLDGQPKSVLTDHVEARIDERIDDDIESFEKAAAIESSEPAASQSPTESSSDESSGTEAVDPEQAAGGTPTSSDTEADESADTDDETEADDDVSTTPSRSAQLSIDDYSE